MYIIRPIIAGILIGATLFFMPFFFVRIILFFLVISLIVRFFIGRRWGYRRRFDATFTDNIRNMSEEEYNRFKQNMAQDCGYHNYNRTQSTANPQ